MKKIAMFSILTLMVALMTAGRVQGQNEEKLGLPGDNLNLYAVMKLFQESETLEGFERSLNDKDQIINNLDLNGDNLVDYIRVLDFVDGEVHNIVLRVALNATENQDVAVFIVMKDSQGNVKIQLIGDEALYGKNYIIEPYYKTEGETPNPGYAGAKPATAGETLVIYETTGYEIASWPLVTYIYAPTYVVYDSPWYYGYYPDYWQPWDPFYWDYYYGYQCNNNYYYYGYYHHTDHHYYQHWDDFYYQGHRTYSSTVSNNIHNNTYNYTYSRPDLREAGSTTYQRRHPSENTSASGRRTGSSTLSNSGGGRTSANSQGNNTSTANDRPSISTGADKSRRVVTSGTQSSEATTNRPNGHRSSVTGGSVNSRSSSETSVTSPSGRTTETSSSGNRSESQNSVSRQSTSSSSSGSSTGSESQRPVVRSSTSSSSSGSSGRSESQSSVSRPSTSSSSSVSSGRSESQSTVVKPATNRQSETSNETKPDRRK